MIYEQQVEKANKKQTQNERMLKRSFVFWFAFFLLLLACDQITKHFAFDSRFGNQLNMFGPVVEKLIFKNYNFAFSLPLPLWLMYGIYFIVLLGIARHLKNNFYKLSNLELTAWIFVSCGACSNVFERMVLGYVRDFIFIAQGIFNLADFYIIFGIILLLATSFKKNNETVYDS